MRLRVVAASCYLAVVYAFLFFPAVIVVVFSFNASRFWAFPLRGFTWRWYEALLERTEALTAIRNSFLVASITTVLAVLIGAAIAIALHRWRLRWIPVAEAVLLMPQLVPSLIWSIALLLLLAIVNFPMGIVSVVIGHTVLTTPYVILLMKARLHTLDPNLEYAARGLGGRTFRIFRRIVLPHVMPAVISGGLVAFAISFSDLIVAVFLSGGGFNTAPVYIYSLIQFEPTPMVNALASTVFGTAVLLILLALAIGGLDVMLLGRKRGGR
jgi:spermidine/putrescine transport system permease protein